MKRVWIAIVIVPAILAGVIGWQVLKPSDEPVYKGRKLSEWLTEVSTGLNWDPEAGSEARDAVREIGPNAIPTLLDWLRARDSALTLRVVALVRRQHVVTVKYTRATERNRLAMWGFEELGTNTHSAVPALIKIADKNISSSSRSYAIVSLGFANATAEQMVPYLREWEPKITGGTNGAHVDLRTRYLIWQVVIRMDPKSATNWVSKSEP